MLDDQNWLILEWLFVLHVSNTLRHRVRARSHNLFMTQFCAHKRFLRAVVYILSHISSSSADSQNPGHAGQLQSGLGFADRVEGEL